MEDVIKQWAPVAISLISLIVSGIALGWNVYRDVVLKARVRVTVAVVRLVTHGQRAGDGDQYVRIGVTNHGPGPVRIEIIVGQQAGIWRRLSRRVKHFVVISDYTNPLNPKLPAKIEVGDTLNLLLPYNPSNFLNSAATHIGVSDSFGRSHFAPHKQLLQAKSQFAKDFGDALKASDS